MNTKEPKEVHIGIDDFDSPRGMCTTYVGAVISSWLDSRPWTSFLDYPYLVRLNPNIPLKTRGNGAVSIHIRLDLNRLDELVDYLRYILNNYADVSHPKADPVIVVFIGPVENRYRKLYRRALTEFIPYKLVSKLVNKRENVIVLKNRKGRGIVGAISSIGSFRLKKCTYELLLYRDPNERERARDIPFSYILEIDRKYRPKVFASVDYEEKRPLVTPHGPDPVMVGFRSVTPLLLKEILEYLKRRVKFERAIIYKTNQGTGAHLSSYKLVSKVRPYDSVIIRGTVSKDPQVIQGGHVALYLSDGTGDLRCMVYRPTGRLSRVARLLRRGDKVEIGGGIIPSVRHGLTLNVEFIKVLRVNPAVKLENPLCPICSSRMVSAGKDKGFKCRKCGHGPVRVNKRIVEIPRILEPGIYMPSPIAYRHLSKPYEILGMTGEDAELVDSWHTP